MFDDKDVEYETFFYSIYKSSVSVNRAVIGFTPEMSIARQIQAWWIDVEPVFRVKNPIKRAFNALQLKFNPNPLNPARRDISLIPIYKHLNTKTGARIFHPYQQIFPMTKQQGLKSLLNEFKQDFNWFAQKLNRQV